MPPIGSNGTADTTPFLTDQIFHSHRRFLRRPPILRGAAQFLRRARMREPSMRVRESAAQQLEEQHHDWAYSRPVVILDLLWNLVFVVVSVFVLGRSRDEVPAVPLRVWVVGYGIQCILHMGCVFLEYKRRYYQQMFFGDEGFAAAAAEGSGGGGGGRWSIRDSNSGYGSEDGEYVSQSPQNEHDEYSVAKNLESANAMFSFIWWIIGFYWISVGGPNLTHDSPQLYWLCITFLAFDVFFVVLCVAVACVIGFAVCCCLPCIIAILYAVADQEGATKDDIERFPKYKFRKLSGSEKQNGEIQESFSGIMTECNTDMPIEHVLPLEDAECCICLCAYEDGTELRGLPCLHHFHCNCIDKWLYINATCPLCKFNILNQSGCEEV